MHMEVILESAKSIVLKNVSFRRTTQSVASKNAWFYSYQWRHHNHIWTQTLTASRVLIEISTRVCKWQFVISTTTNDGVKLDRKHGWSYIIM